MCKPYYYTLRNGTGCGMPVWCTGNRGREMKAESEWERFTCSGKITDYLAFKDREAVERAGDRAGEKIYAGFRRSNGNGNQNDACR